MTNRDFYKAIESLLHQRKTAPTITLEQFLLSLWSRGSERKTDEAIPLTDFFLLLRDSFTPVETCLAENPIDEAASGFAGWDSTICRQINDLKEMNANGQLQGKYCYFGIQSPSGQSWYNLDPCTYIECATAGSLGGWEAGDDTDRQYVPGRVAATNEQGEVIFCDPRELQKPAREIAGLSWDQMKDFLWCGQNYE